MQKGKKSINNVKENQVREILQNIIDSCIKYAGDSYEDFSRDTIKILRQAKLVDYGYPKEKENEEEMDR